MSAPAHRFFTLGPGAWILLVVLVCLAGLVRLAVGGTWLEATSEPEPSREIDLVARVGETLRCPYCHDDLVPREVSCFGCGTGYHAECYLTHGDCALLGCGDPPARRTA